MPSINRLPCAAKTPFTTAPLLAGALLAASILVAGSALTSAARADDGDAAQTDIDTSQTQQSTDGDSSWLNNVRAACAQQYSAEQCADSEFLERQFHVGDLQTAHRAAIRRNELERRALRELMLQRACNNTTAYCANAVADCAAQLQQMCATIKKEAASCAAQAARYCATTGQGSDCIAQRQALCPSVKKQTVDKLLAKYPRLTAAQKAHIKQMAAQMDAKDSSWIDTLFRWLGF